MQTQVRPGSATDSIDRNAERVRVAVIGSTGYAGGELVRILARHPNVELVGLTGRGRTDEAIGSVHPHLAATGLSIDEDVQRATADADAVFLALPHGAAAEQVAAIADRGIAVIDLGPDFRLHDPADYPRWYRFEHPAPSLLATAVYGLPELHRSEISALRWSKSAIVGSPGCYPTATLLALAPLARAGLIADVAIDAKSGVSGAGREAKADMLFSEVNESVKPYGVGSHRHTAEIEQELALAAGAGSGASSRPAFLPLEFLPHLIPMTRGILASCHVRPTRPVEQGELDALYRAAYADEPFVRVSPAPPATKHVTGSNHAVVHVHADARTGRVLAFGVIDNLVKGAAGQAVQAFNLVHGLPETTGLEALPVAP
jgi:N-acetyl-gamma-glutamyl-phosphate reductase